MDDNIFKHLDHTDNICLLSHRLMDLDQMTVDLKNEAGKAGLKTSTNKTKVICQST